MLPLADPEVGYVTGRMVYKAPDGSLTGEGCSAYMKYENKLREWETDLGSIVGVDGGVDAMRREDYTLVLMDVHMPGLSGPEASEAIRSLPGASLRGTPIIAVTADTLWHYGSRYKDHGFDCVLPKPVHVESLNEVVRHYTA